MWTTCAIAAALSLAPVQADGELALTNIRNTYGLLGATRPDNKLVPGDIFFIAFDMENVNVDEAGEVRYSMGMEVRDTKGKIVYKQEPKDLKALNSTGGRRVPCFAHVVVGTDQPPGKYTVKVSVADRGTKNRRSASFEREFEVLPRTFGLVRVGLSSDSGGQVAAPPVAVPGQLLWLNCLAVGYERTGAKKQGVDLSIEMQILDENGKPTTKPFAYDVKNVEGDPATTAFIPMAFTLALNRPGKFTIKLKGVDHAQGDKSSEAIIPFTVVDQK